MAKRAEIVLDPEGCEVLERWVRRPKTSQALAFRCRIVLAAAEPATSKEIALQLGCNPSTVGRWRGRFAERGLDGLHDEARPGKPRSITDADVERVIVKTLEEQPVAATHWSTRSMAQATGPGSGDRGDDASSSRRAVPPRPDRDRCRGAGAPHPCAASALGSACKSGRSRGVNGVLAPHTVQRRPSNPAGSDGRPHKKSAVWTGSRARDPSQARDVELAAAAYEVGADGVMETRGDRPDFARDAVVGVGVSRGTG
jgi:transposase-like protein